MHAYASKCMCMHVKGGYVGRMGQSSWVRGVCGLAILGMGACTTFGGVDESDAAVADSGGGEPTDGQGVRDGAGEAAVGDAGVDASVACRPPRPVLDATFGTRDIPVTGAVAALALDGALFVVGRATCGDGGRQMALYRVANAGAATMLGCLGDDLEVAVAIDVDPTGIAIASQFIGSGYIGARLWRLTPDGRPRDAVVQQTSATTSVVPTAVRRVAGRDVWAYYSSPSNGTPEGSLRVEGGAVRTTSVGPSAVVAFGGSGASLVSVLVPLATLEPPIREVSVARATLVGDTLVADTNFGSAGKVAIAATSPNPIQYTQASLTSQGAVVVGIPQQATATARFLKTTQPKAELTLGPVGNGVAQVAVTMTCDGAVVIGHATGQTGHLSRFGAPDVTPTADPAWGLDLPRPPKALLTGGDEVFVVYEDAGKTRIVRLDR